MIMSNIILDKIFGENNWFNLDDYKDFLNEVFKQYFNGNISWKLKSNDNKEYHLIKLWTFEDNNWEKMDILVIKSPTRTKVERARVEQRKILSYYLKNTWIFQWVNNLLVVFYSDDEDSNDWRLSFIKQEFKLDEQKKKVVNEFTPAKRKSFLIEQTSKNKTVKDQFNPILEQKESPTISQIEWIFSVEKVTKEFFQEYKKLYSKLKDEFSNDNIFSFINQKYNNWDEYFTENFVKKLMGQIVFLYFIQKKWWLWVSNDKEFGLWEQNYIRKIYDESINWWDSKKENWWKYFFNDYLEHLFYEALNSDRRDKNDWSEYFGCRIPYLNWWLFEPINWYDWSWPQNTILVENKIFGEILDKFDLYNFTIYENDPLEQDVAVDPEMLGKIFENLLPDNERKWKGAFYTPREIVHYMTRESLINHIITDTWIEEEKVRKLFEYKDAMIFKKDNDNKLTDKEKFDIFDEFEPYAKNIDKSLENIKIVDPAVGSGAFPMWLLQEIVWIRYYIRENILLDDSLSLYNLKKQTLENCIYGVDIDPWAVEIAKLRFWLSLVVENDTDKIDPLPNLDYKIMQGNSLLEDLIIWESSISLITDKDLWLKRTSKDKDAYMRWATLDFLNFDELLNKLKYLHKKFFKETNNIQKKQIKLELDQIEKDLIRRKCEEEVNRIQSQIDNIQIKYTLSWQWYTDKDAKLIAKYFDDISKIKDVEKKFEKDNIRPFFPWKLHFGEIFIEKWGFDIVIWNPPYVQLQKDNWYLWKLFEKVWFQTYAKTGDIYWLFYEFSFRLLKQWWISTFITSNKWMRAWYGQSLRKFFVKNTNPLILIDLWAWVFETATVDTNILISKNEKVKNFQLKALDLTKQKQIGKIEDYKDRFVEINSLTDDVWSILNPLQQNIKNKIEKIWTPLKDWNIKIYRWVLTWFNEAFIIDWKKKDELIQADPKNAEIIKPILRGRDIRKYYCDFADLWLIFIPWHFPLHKDPLISWNSKEAELEFQKQYTVIYNHLLQYKKQLSNRNKEETWIRYEWYVLQRCAASYYEEFEKDKIVWSETWQKIKMTIAEWWIYLDKTCFMLIWNHLKYICSIFNSKIIDFFARSNLCWLWENGLSLKKTDMELIPIPHVSKPQQEPFIDMVDKILAITSKEDYNPKDLNSDDVQQVKKYERQIDVMVYKLYELTYDEVLVVDPEFWLSKEEYESFSW
mgnify:CR=1 FL=1